MLASVPMLNLTDHIRVVFISLKSPTLLKVRLFSRTIIVGHI